MFHVFQTTNYIKSKLILQYLLHKKSRDTKILLSIAKVSAIEYLV